MNVIADLCIVPIGVGVSVSPYIAACQRILTEAGLDIQLHANGTNVEGEWGDVLDTVRECVETVHEMGAPRVSTWLKLSTRTDRDQSMDEMVRSVREKLDRG
jgi:uncharacterized protein (TIGR00106 family)